MQLRRLSGWMGEKYVVIPGTNKYTRVFGSLCTPCLEMKTQSTEPFSKNKISNSIVQRPKHATK